MEKAIAKERNLIPAGGHDAKVHVGDINMIIAHSLTRDLNAWRTFGYTAALKNEFGLILFHARGRGRRSV